MPFSSNAYMAAIEFKNDRYKTVILEVHVCHLILLIIRIPKCIICHMSDISLWGYAEVKRSKFTWKCELLTLNNLIIHSIIWVWSLFVQKVQRSTTFSHLGILGPITKHRTYSIPKLIKIRTNQTVAKTSQSTWSHAFYSQIHSQWGCLARHFATRLCHLIISRGFRNPKILLKHSIIHDCSLMFVCLYLPRNSSTSCTIALMSPHLH